MVFQRIDTRRAMGAYCHYPAANGSCEREIADERERCYLHGDGGGTPPGHGAPAGNDNAVGNSGGGAPAGNWNAAKHHGWSDSLKHYHRLAGQPREMVNTYIREWREQYAEYHGLDTDGTEVEQHIVATRDFESIPAVRDAFRKLGAMYDQCWRAKEPTFKEGLVVEEEVEFETADGETVTYTNPKVNPAVEAEFRLTSKRRELEGELGLIENERYLQVWLSRRSNES